MAYYEYYQWAWVIYLGASVALLLTWFWMTSGMKAGDMRQYVRMVPAVLLFTPAVHSDALAPAFIVAFGELFTNGVQAALMGFIPLLVALLLGAIALAVAALFRKPAKPAHK